MPGRVIFEQHGPLARVTLSHPGKLGAMSRAMWRELKAVFGAVQASQDLRCVVVQGEGGAFCAGGDIAEYPEFRFEEASLRDFHEGDVWGGLGAMLACDVPIIAMIEGACMGAGVEIASCCDIRVASADAKFGAPIARLGFPMAPREVEVVAREAGLATLREMLLQAAVFGAAEMHRRGFLHEVAAPADLASRTAVRADAIAALAPQAARLNKRALRRVAQAFSEENRAAGRAGTARAAIDSVAGAYAYADSGEHREGIAAFLEKRKPAF
jgi:enoyl-CoA hydratase/carnithine racemase